MYHRSKGLTFQAALRDIEASRPADRVAAAEVLSSAQSEEEHAQAFAALAAATGDTRPEVRSTACVALAELEQEQAWEIISLCLSDAVPEVRQCAAIALGSLGAKEAFPPLLEALQTGPVDLRFQAASSLVEVDLEAAYQPLLDALAEETDAEVIGAIALSLGAIGNRACADQLADLLEHHTATTRMDAAYALAQLSDPRALEQLAAALPDADGGWDAAMALEELGELATDALGDFLAGSKGAPRVRIRAAGALLSLSPAHRRSDAARHILCEALRNRKLELRGLALQELSKVGGPWALAPLRALQRSFRGRSMSDEIAEVLAALEEGETKS